VITNLVRSRIDLGSSQSAEPFECTASLFSRPLSILGGPLYASIASIAFYLAYSSRFLSVLIVGYVFCLLQLARLRSGRAAFYFALAAGFLSAAPQLYCFWTIFGPTAIALWLILAFWVALFVSLVRLCRLRLPLWAPFLVPVIWTGLEFFRSELYYLRFSWLNVGYAFAGILPSPIFHGLGVYGVGFGVAATAVALSVLKPATAAKGAAGVVAAFAALLLLQTHGAFNRLTPASKPLAVAGVQLEFPSEAEVRLELVKLLRRAPEAQLLVLSEYTFLDTIPDSIKRWCREHQRYLIVGGKDPAPNGDFYDTAFVVGPTGEIVFSQGKSVPIQFFRDGLPAREQRLWESPWGRLGLCVCYDLSYTRVTDELVRSGAQAIIVPTMDVADWGRRQHELHARVAPVRAAEYGIPIFRLASSGISQLIDRSGHEVANAGFPGQGEMLVGEMQVARSGSRPIDRWLAPFCTWSTLGVCLWLFFMKWLLRQKLAP
jgi:apolipoprotein N-acyltransferase